MSDVKRFVEDAPVTGEERFQTVAVVRASGVYLLGTLVKDRYNSGLSWGWRTDERMGEAAQVVQAWAQAHRIAATGSKRGSPSGAQANCRVR